MRDECLYAEYYWPRPWPYPRIRDNGAVKELAKLGRAAVPELIKALTDERPSRSVVRNHRHGGSAYPMPIGQLAHGALEKIAGVYFYGVVASAGNASAAQRNAGTAEAVQEWYEGTARLGEEKWLLEKCQSGEYGAEQWLSALAKRHPKASREVAVVAARLAKDPIERSKLMAKLKDIKSAEATKFLIDEVHTGPTLKLRAQAAMLLHERGNAAGRHAMLRQWEEEKWPAEKLTVGSVNSAPPESLAHVLDFFFRSGDAEGINAVAEAWGELPKDARYAVLSLIRDARWDGAFGKRVAHTAAGDVAMKVLLMRALADETRLENASIQGAKNPRIGEIAAEELSARWPRKYTFSLKGSAAARDRALAKVRAAAKD
jgi:hypothetical protein